ncbi:MAG: glucose-6-phosphate dehydrogenase [Myxococcota bacterium]
MTQTVQGGASLSHQTPDACTVVIFGAGGDLTKRLLWPALCNLGKDGLLSQSFAVVGCGRTSYSSKEFRQHLQRSLTQFSPHAESRKWGRQALNDVHYLGGDALQATLHNQLAKLLQRLQKQHNTLGNVLFYLATPPSCFAPIVQQLGKAGLTKQDNGWRRVVVEKPFGHDLASAQQLNQQLGAILSEDQIFRIDHYLGKETVQNLLAFRFANGIFEPIWNRRYIDHVQITVAETLGVQQRAAYYETAGALRDMVPNHLFQLLSLIAMEPPNSFAAHDVRDEKAKLLRAVHCFSPEEVLTHSVRGQYAAAVVNKVALLDYRQEPNVDPQSATETFVAFKLFVPNWRWAGVPFYLRTGKRLPKRVTEITIQFKKPPMLLFEHIKAAGVSPNVLTIRIQPQEGIWLRVGAKVPGPAMRIKDVTMHFSYQEQFNAPPGTGYETLLYDCMMGDATLFQRDDMVQLGWSIVQPMLDVWSALNPRAFPNYACGTWGPQGSDDLLGRDGRQWIVM